MTARELIAMVGQVGGTLELQGDGLGYELPEEAEHLIDELRAHKAEIIRELCEYNSNALLMLGFALDNICKSYPHDCATGTDTPLHWCRTAYPLQCRYLTADMPAKIDALMDRRAPFAELKAVLDEWVSLHLWMYAAFREVRLRVLQTRETIR